MNLRKDHSHVKSNIVKLPISVGFSTMVDLPSEFAIVPSYVGLAMWATA